MDVRPRDRAESGHTTSHTIQRHTSFAQILLAVCLTVITIGSVCLVAKADVPMSEYIRLFFERDGEPFDQPVRFYIACYGYKWDPGPDYPPTRVPGSYEPGMVYSISGNCPHYGCRIAHELYLNYTHIDYCDLVAKTEDQDYTLSNYASWPMSACDGMECWLRVDLATSAVLRVSPEPLASASPVISEFAESRTYEETFLIALLLSLLIEAPIVFAMVRFVFRLREIGWLRLLITGVLATSLTLPCLWFIAPEVLDPPYALVVGEILVFLVETAIYAFVLQIGIGRALLVSFVANLASLVLGALLL